MSNGRWKLLVSVGLCMTALGCQPKSRIRDDPFLPTAGRRSSDVDARDDYRATPRERDLSRGVSTSPATDDDYGRPRGSSNRDESYASNARDRDRDREPSRDRGFNDPLIPSDRLPPEKSQAIGNRTPSREAGYAKTESAKNRDDAPRGPADADAASAAQFEKIRRRLDKLGAKNICLEPYDRATGEMAFRCEVPIPNATDRVRVFEAHSNDEIKLMTAIAEAAEKWVAEQRN